MNIVDFTAAHIEQAAIIAKQNYDEERGHVPALPPVTDWPDMSGFAKSNLGVAAVDSGELLGFLCWHEPRDNHFGLCKGTWSPMHAHGAAAQNRTDIYDRLYQAAAEKLVSAGVLSHSITLYEHDAEANKAFFQNGFGGRCVDAIRETTPINAPLCGNITFRQAGADDAEAVAGMSNGLVEHLHQSPIFIPFFKTFASADIENGINNGDYQYFIALEQNTPVAYIRLQQTGENFACDHESMMNISGAYSLPGIRGTGVFAGLLSWLTDWLRKHGFSRCGVDFECFNFTARKFWLKYFTAYTNGAVRRIDERICKKYV